MSAGKYSITEPDGYLEPRIGKTGFSSIPAKTCIEVFQETVAKHGDRKALFLKRAVGGKLPAEGFNFTWTWKEYYADCCKFAKTLIHLNVGAFKIVNILGFNSPEWCIANNGSLLASCIAAGIYATNSPEACHYISQHSKTEVVVVDGNMQLKKYASSAKADFPFLKAIVVYAEEVLDKDLVSKCAFPVYLWSDFLKLGEKEEEHKLNTRFSNVGFGNCSTLIYTSGTTGPPKAVMISHDNITWTAKNMCDNYFDLNHNDRIISFLPMSHIAAQIFDIHVPMALGCALYFCQPDVLKVCLYGVYVYIFVHVHVYAISSFNQMYRYVLSICIYTCVYKYIRIPDMYSEYLEYPNRDYM
jgi:long-chain-fatty-acid--CoA ligase ACSBG